MSVSQSILKTLIKAEFEIAKIGFMAAGGQLPKPIKEALEAVPSILVGKVKEEMANIEDDQWLTMLSAFVNAGIISEKDTTRYYNLRKLAHPFDWIMYVITTAKLFFNYISLISEGNMAKQSQHINAETRPYLPNYSDVINAAFVAPEKTGEVKDIMKRTGLKDKDIDLLFLSRYNLYPVETVKELFLRGILSEQMMYVRMRELGFTDTRIKEMVQAWEIIPGPQDLFWMVGKEAFEPDQIRALGLGDDFPTEQLQWLNKQGISTEWAKKYWYAHWDQPSIQQGFEMLHRGVIGFDTLDVLFRTVEIPPFWRDKLTQIAYRPLSRVDVRRMHKMGVIDNNRLVKAYTDLGYNDSDAVLMAEFTIAYNQGTTKGLTKSQILSSYRERMINNTDAKDLLMSIGVGEDEAAFLLYHEDYKRDLDYNNKRIKNIGDKYKLGITNQLTVRSELGKLNLTAEKMELLIDEWEIDKYESTAIPSKTDLTKFLINGIISKDQFRSEMQKLGYTALAVEWYEKLIDKQTRSA